MGCVLTVAPHCGPTLQYGSVLPRSRWRSRVGSCIRRTAWCSPRISWGRQLYQAMHVGVVSWGTHHRPRLLACPTDVLEVVRRRLLVAALAMASIHAQAPPSPLVRWLQCTATMTSDLHHVGCRLSRQERPWEAQAGAGRLVCHLGGQKAGVMTLQTPRERLDNARLATRRRCLALRPAAARSDGCSSPRCRWELA